MSKLVRYPGAGGESYVAIERDDGMLVLANDYIPAGAGGMGITIDGKRLWFVRRADFAAELEASGLQPVWLS